MSQFLSGLPADLLVPYKENTPLAVNTVAPEVLKMAKNWRLIDDLLGGTEAMRAAGTRHLPKRNLETDEDYEARLSQTTLFPALAETIKDMVGRVFAEQLVIGEDVPDWIKDEVLNNIDLQGRDLHTYCKEWFNKAIAYGHAFTLAESPKTDGVQTQADQKAAGVRPYLVLISPHRVLGWRLAADGSLAQVRILFVREEPVGDFGVTYIYQIRVYEIVQAGDRLGKVQVRTFETDWVKNKSWNEISAIPQVLDVTRIPLVPLYTQRTGVNTSIPPLRELAYLNIKHWRKQSTCDDLIEVAKVPILATVGVNSGDKIVIGAKHAVRLPTDGDLKYVEHTGAAIEAGQNDLEKCEAEMRQSGARLLQPTRDMARTATESSEEAARENSQLGSMVSDLEDTIADSLDLVAMWRGDDDGGSVEARPNLKPNPAPEAQITALLPLRDRGILSDQTMFNEAKRRDMIAEEMKWEDEQARVKEQGPPMPPPSTNPFNKPGNPDPAANPGG